MGWRRCPECGAYLDPGERCDCGAPEIPTPVYGLARNDSNGERCDCSVPEIPPQGHFLALRAQGATPVCGLARNGNKTERGGAEDDGNVG